MSLNSTSVQIFASYSNVMVRTEPSKQMIADEQINSAVPVQLDRLDLSPEEAWKYLCGAEITDTTADDGTVTQSISGGVGIIGPNGKGISTFQVSISFRSSEYQPGQLAGTIDLLAAARQVQQNALRDCFSGAELAQKTAQMEELYQQRKEETASSFADMVGTQMENRGQTGETQKIYRSVQALFVSFEAKYQTVADSTGQDNWMDPNLLTATLNLQKIGASIKVGNNKQEGFYTLQEMEFAAIGVRRGLNIHA